jgi:hypothetical protein
MRPNPLAGLACGLIAALASASAASEPAHYSMADFGRVDKIDAHVHLHSDAPQFTAFARQLRFKVFTINVDYPDFPPIDEQQRVAVALARRQPTQVAWAAAFPVEGSNAPGWAAATTARIDRAVAQGASGVKVWKNIGMSLRAADGSMVMVDDARFALVFDHLAGRGIPLLGHQGEPRNCWLPLAQMTVNNDRQYFKEHPQYHMALHPELPSYEAQMAARDRMLAQHPRMKFVGMHLASLEWDVDEIGRFLDSHPTAVVDMAARIGQLQYQSQRDPDKVRRFFYRYQDRLLYGTDLTQEPGAKASDFMREAKSVWLSHWRYFNTGDAQTVPELDKPVRGLALPREIIDKLYAANVRRVYPQAWRGAH